MSKLEGALKHCFYLHKLWINADLSADKIHCLGAVFFSTFGVCYCSFRNKYTAYCSFLRDLTTRVTKAALQTDVHRLTSASTTHFKMWRWEHVWRLLFNPAWVCFRTQEAKGQTVWKTITGPFSRQMTHVVAFFIPPHSQSSVPSAYLIPAAGQTGWGCERGGIIVLNRRHKYSGSASLTVAVKIISASSPHRVLSSHLCLWFRRWPNAKKLIHILEMQNDSKQRMTR